MRIALAILALVVAPSLVADDAVVEAVDSRTCAELKPRAAAVMSELVGLYRARTDPAAKADVARCFYALGQRSDEAREALMADVHTTDQTLRLEVQWALGRVSDAPEVVDVLLANMREDGNALFRDKAGCALAYDQVHLTPRQKLRLYRGVIDALDDEQPDVRRIGILVLSIHTSQTKGFHPFAPPEQRAEAVKAWRAWLAEYESEL